MLYSRLCFDEGEMSRWKAYAASKDVSFEQLLLAVFRACPLLPGDVMNDIGVAEGEKAERVFLASLSST